MFLMPGVVDRPIQRSAAQGLPLREQKAPQLGTPVSRLRTSEFKFKDDLLVESATQAGETALIAADLPEARPTCCAKVHRI